MGKNRFGQGHSVPDFVDKFGTALAYFSLKVRETANIKHAGSRGTERELKLANFIDDLLPGTYAAASGEVVDLKGEKSPQLDVLVYDQIKNFPFYSGNILVLPAEALLASIEVKTSINSDEIKSSQDAAQKLKSLRPMKKPLVTSQRARETHLPPSGYRYIHGLFAYKTDLVEANWAKHELDRLERHASGDVEQCIDLLYVLGKGLVDTRSRTFIREDETTGQALVAFYFALYNFIDRENRRRPRAPYFNYATDLNRFWQRVE